MHRYGWKLRISFLAAGLLFALFLAPFAASPPAAGAVNSSQAVDATSVAFDLGDLRPVSLSPDGQLLAATDRQQLCVIEVEGFVTRRCASLDVLDAGIRVGDISWSPDSSKLVFAEDAFTLWKDGDIWLMDALDGSLTNLTDDGYSGMLPAAGLTSDQGATVYADIAPTWTPDGTGITFSRSIWEEGSFFGNDIVTIPVTGGNPDFVTTVSSDTPGLAYFSMRWTGDESALYYSVLSAVPDKALNGIYRLTTATGESERVLASGDESGAPALLQLNSNDEFAIVWYPQMAAIGGAAAVYSVLDLQTGELIPIQPNAETDLDRMRQGAVQTVGFSPDGDSVANARSNGSVWSLDLLAGEEHALIEDLERVIYLDHALPLSWSETGDLLVETLVGIGLVFRMA
ncbi:MAG: PD40 domain-containing protein [Thermomicrobiales bacterium]|jgi:WD40 repeat protein|nr:PD40 domain-containing protein [Thermomicrobiales bacterium]